MESVTARAHGSSANLSSGYDIIAVSLDKFSDEVTIQRKEGTGKIIIQSDHDVPLLSSQNSAGIPVVAMTRDFGIRDDILIKIKKGIQICSGLGGSAASAVAATVALNKLYSLRLDPLKLASYAALGESASGSVHYDNIAASILGGITLVTGTSPLKVLELKAGKELKFLIVLPENRMKENTNEMRKLVPAGITLEDHVENSRSLASLINGIYNSDRESIKRGLQDRIVEPARSIRYPYFASIKKAAEEYDALGAYISGSGPAVSIVIDQNTRLSNLKASVDRIMKDHNIPYSIHETGVSGGFEVE